jgi:hypothetical protein
MDLSRPLPELVNSGFPLAVGMEFKIVASAGYWAGFPLAVGMSPQLYRR